MDKTLIDSCVWIEYFRSGKGKVFDYIDLLIDKDTIALCGIVEMEIYQGLRKKEKKEISNLFSLIPYVDIERKDYIQAGVRMAELRKKGITIPSTDSIIATICERRNLSLLTMDKHFDHFENLKRISL